jgi:hypothetical protein
VSADSPVSRPTINPGHDSIGTLTTGNLIQRANWTNIFEMANQGANVADRLRVFGTVNLSNATLRLVLSNSFAPAPGESFTLIDNDGADAVNGTFAGLPQGALLTNQLGGSNFVFQINYAGGSGNDVTLTAPGASVPSAIQSSGVNSNGLFTLAGVGFPNTSYILEATTNLNTPIPWQPIATNLSGGGGLYQFIDPNSTNFPIRFYRVRSP